MARLGKLRPGPFTAALAVYDVWRRLSPKQRAQIAKLARKHGPTVAKQAVKLRSRLK
jgi:hypothetical protein